MAPVEKFYVLAHTRKILDLNMIVGPDHDRMNIFYFSKKKKKKYVVVIICLVLTTYFHGGRQINKKNKKNTPKNLNTAFF